MSTWVCPEANDDRGPYLCHNGGTEFASAIRRYHRSEINEDVIERLIFMFQNLRRDAPERTSAEDFEAFLREHKGERVYFDHH